jgi:Asp-tRNA(Asn)/Glu-tRNA(Gln) amidotransferase A subunit family amidase
MYKSYPLKSFLDTARVRTTHASAIFEHNFLEHDAVAVTRMKAAGSVPVGKVSTLEFGHKRMNEAPLFGRAVHP